jgi:hypothetical protein
MSFSDSIDDPYPTGHYAGTPPHAEDYPAYTPESGQRKGKVAGFLGRLADRAAGVVEGFVENNTDRVAGWADRAVRSAGRAAADAIEHRYDDRGRIVRRVAGAAGSAVRYGSGAAGARAGEWVQDRFGGTTQPELTGQPYATPTSYDLDPYPQQNNQTPQQPYHHDPLL